MLTITHTAAQGTLIDGTDKGDRAGVVLSTCGWRWSRAIGDGGSWYLPRTRDAHPKVDLITITAYELRTAGFQVQVKLDHSLRSTAEVEAEKIARQPARVTGLTAKADRLSAAADQLHEAAHREATKYPMGQPIIAGHHSQPAMEKSDRRIRELTFKAAETRSAANDARSAAVAAGYTFGVRYTPVTVANRIEQLAAKARLLQRRLDSATDPRDRSRIEVDRDEVREQVAFWEGVRTEQLATGQAEDHNQDNTHSGDQVRIGGTWYTVAKPNKKTVTLQVPPGTQNKAPYIHIQEKRSA